MEPAITWNLLLTAVGIPALAFYLKYILQKRDALKEKLYSMHLETVLEKYDLLRQDIARLNAKVEEIERSMHSKVDRSDCEKDSNDVWSLLKHHRHDSDGKVIDTT